MFSVAKGCLNTVAMFSVRKCFYRTQWPCLHSQRVVTEYSGHVCSHRVVNEYSGNVCSHKSLFINTVAMFPATKCCH